MLHESSLRYIISTNTKSDVQIRMRHRRALQDTEMVTLYRI